MSKSRGWAITINNYTKEDIKTVKELEGEYCFQEETGESGTKHLQGMVYYKNARSFNQMKNMFRTAHIEKMKNKIASIKYCSKEETRTGKIYTNIDLAKYVKDTDTDTIESYEKSKNIFEDKNYYFERLNFLTNLKFEDKETYDYLRENGNKADLLAISTIEELASFNL